MEYQELLKKKGMEQIELFMSGGSFMSLFDKLTEKEEVSRFQVRMPSELNNRLKELCELLDISMNEGIVKILAMGVSELEKDPRIQELKKKKGI